jgi:hypothetical protein
MAYYLHAFDGLTGAHVRRLDFSALSWSESINEVGSMSATVVDDGSIDPSSCLRAYGTILAVLDENNAVRHAGYIKQWTYNKGDGTYSVSAGGGATILTKRIVLNHALASSWTDGTVVIDDDNPPGDWVLTADGSYSDLIRALIVETEKWGSLPITPASSTGGDKTRTWDSWDLATVADRISDIGDLDAGPEWRFDPQLSDAWVLSFQQVTSADSGEIVDNTWVWNALVPASGVVLGDQDADGSDMASACYMTGGKDDDTLLIAHSVGATLTDAGWPLLQVADTSHSTVSVLSTLQSYATATVSASDVPSGSVALTVPATSQVHVGDWANVRYGSNESDVLELKVTDVSCAAKDTTQTLGCRLRG